MNASPPTADTIVARARELLDRNDPHGAIDLIARFFMSNPPQAPRGLHLVRGLAYLRLNVWQIAIHSFRAELYLDPENTFAREQLDALTRQVFPTGSSRPAERPWQTALGANTIRQLEMASQRYEWRSVPMVKNCFDFAIYPLLLDRVRPRTIVEIGTLYGGSASWLSDLTGAMGLATEIYSIDVFNMPLVQPPRVTFMHGDGRDLAKTLPPEFLAALPRPLLVIEDADHARETSLAVLNFFHPVLRGGEYIVVEDGMSAPGPQQALHEFFAAHGNDYDVDATLCDYFGTNVTWCVNGFLRKRG